MNNNLSTQTNRNRSGLVAGAILILIGTLILAAQFAEPAPWMFFGTLALIFITAGLITRQIGLVIPGGVLTGVGLGVHLVEGPFKNAAEPINGGVFLLSLAAGFALICLVSVLMRALDKQQSIQVWPLFPAAGLGLFGGLLATNNLTALEFIGQGWPVVLIVIGLYLILRRKQMQE